MFIHLFYGESLKFGGVSWGQFCVLARQTGWSAHLTCATLVGHEWIWTFQFSLLFLLLFLISYSLFPLKNDADVMLLKIHHGQNNRADLRKMCSFVIKKKWAFSSYRVCLSFAPRSAFTHSFSDEQTVLRSSIHCQNAIWEAATQHASFDESR